MASRNAVVALAAITALGMLGSLAPAAVVAPVKAYAKADEAIVVKFLNEKGESGKKALLEIGVAATKLDDLFTAAAQGEIASGDGAPSFQIFGTDGKALKPAPVKVNAD